MSRIFTLLVLGWFTGTLLVTGCHDSVTGMEENAVSLSPEVFTGVQGSNATAGNTLDAIGFYVTGATNHATYPGTSTNGDVFTRSGDTWTPTSPLVVNGTKGRLYAWAPSTATLTPDAANGKHVVPVTVPASQTCTGETVKEVNDYLYGAGTDATASVTPVIVSSQLATPAIYMQHALARVVFNVQYDSREASDNNHVKSVKLTAVGNSFLSGTGKLQVGDGTLTGLTGTKELTFTPAAGAEQAVGTTPVTAASGLVAPLASTPSVTLTITLGTKSDATHDRTYTLTSAGINVQWKRGYSYIYNLKLGNYIEAEQIAVPWGSQESTTPVTPEERGIGSAEKLAAFAAAWNLNGDQGAKNAEFYKEYGWEEVDASGNKTFKIKLTKPIKLIATSVDDILWQPIGTADKPLTVPIDGQGWLVSVDLSGIGTGAPAGKLKGEYAGMIGYTTSDIYNVRVTNAYSSTIEFTDARYAGVLAGKVEGDIVNCSVELNDVTLLNSCTTLTGTMYLGGMAGYCGGSIRNSAVYAASGYSLSIGFTRASANSYLGGLAGMIAGNSVNNCYTRISRLSNGTTANPPSTGVLAGDYPAGVFSNCHYIAGCTLENCTEKDPTGIAAEEADFSTLGATLNAVAQANDWATWTEEIDGTTSNVTSVYLFKYRNKN